MVASQSLELESGKSDLHVPNLDLVCSAAAFLWHTTDMDADDLASLGTSLHSEAVQLCLLSVLHNVVLVLEDLEGFLGLVATAGWFVDDLASLLASSHGFVQRDKPSLEEGLLTSDDSVKSDSEHLVLLLDCLAAALLVVHHDVPLCLVTELGSGSPDSCFVLVDGQLGLVVLVLTLHLSVSENKDLLLPSVDLGLVASAVLLGSSNSDFDDPASFSASEHSALENELSSASGNHSLSSDDAFVDSSCLLATALLVSDHDVLSGSCAELDAFAPSVSSDLQLQSSSSGLLDVESDGVSSDSHNLFSPSSDSASTAGAWLGVDDHTTSLLADSKASVQSRNLLVVDGVLGFDDQSVSSSSGH